MKPLHLFGILGAGVVLFGLLSLSITPDDPAPVPPVPAVRALPDAEYLINLRRSGGDAAIAPYEGRRLIVRGNFKEAVINPDGDPVIVLDAGREADMRCPLEGKNRVSLAHLKRGDMVYISGMNLLAGTHLVHFRGQCRLATPVEVEAAKQP